MDEEYRVVRATRPSRWASLYGAGTGVETYEENDFADEVKEANIVRYSLRAARGIPLFDCDLENKGVAISAR